MISRYAEMDGDANRTVGTPCPRGYVRILFALAVIVRPLAQPSSGTLAGFDVRGRHATDAGQPQTHVTAWALRV